MKPNLRYSLMITSAGVVGLLGTANAASVLTLEESFILTSDNNGGSGNFDISVESSYQGYSGVADLGGGAPGEPVSGTFNGTVTAYRFWNAVSNAPNTLAQSGGVISDLTTTDSALSNFNRADIWVTTAPNGAAFDTAPDYDFNIGDITDFSGSVDITDISSGSFYIIYGAYRSTPNISISMTGSVTASDMDITNIHNGDFANNNEYYLARVDFTNDDGYTSLDWGTAGAANYRFSGVVLTAIPEPSSLALVSISLLALFRRRR